MFGLYCVSRFGLLAPRARPAAVVSALAPVAFGLAPTRRAAAGHPQTVAQSISPRLAADARQSVSGLQVTGDPSTTS